MPKFQFEDLVKKLRRPNTLEKKITILFTVCSIIYIYHLSYRIYEIYIMNDNITSNNYK